MTLVALATAHGAAAAAAPKPAVLVPHGSRGVTCAAEAALAAELSLAAGIELVRAAVDERESIEDARLRTDSDFALAARPAATDASTDAATTQWSLTLAAADRATTTASGPELAVLLRALWPPDLPPLVRRAVPAAATPGALAAACAGDAARAYALSGAAIGPALWRELAPPGPPPRKDDLLGLDLARALATARAGRSADALTRVRRVATRLLGGESWPLWRTADGGGAASVAIAGGAALVLRNGTLEAYDVATGVPLGRAVVGRVAAPLTAIGGRILAAGPTAVTAIDARSGAIVWSSELVAPWPEVVELDDRVVIAGAREIIAISPATGEALWRLDAPVEPSAGPVEVGRYVVVPAETELLVIDPRRGKLVVRADVGDEIAGPLLAVGTDVWCAIGADGVGRLDVAALAPTRGARESARLERLAQGVFGGSWPPAVTTAGLVLAATDPKRGPYLARVVGDGDGPAEMFVRNLLGPTHSLGADRTLAVEKRRDAVVALDGAGKTVWRVALGAPVRLVEVALGSAWIAAGTKVWTVDAISGRVDRVVDVGEPVRALAVSPGGVVAVGDGGTAWGLPAVEDPRMLPVLRELRRAEARAALALGRTADATAALEATRSLDPEDVEVLVTLARLADRPGAQGAPRAWLRVLDAARPRESAGAEARARLAAAIGLVATAQVGGTARALVATRDRAIAEVGPEVMAIGVDGAILWRRTGHDLTRTDAAILVDGVPIRPRDGAPDADATVTSTVVTPQLSVSASGGLVVTDPVRKQSQRPLDVGAAGPAAATPTHAWVAREASILVLELRPR